MRTPTDEQRGVNSPVLLDHRPVVFSRSAALPSAPVTIAATLGRPARRNRAGRRALAASAASSALWLALSAAGVGGAWAVRSSLFPALGPSSQGYLWQPPRTTEPADALEGREASVETVAASAEPAVTSAVTVPGGETSTAATAAEDPTPSSGAGTTGSGPSGKGNGGSLPGATPAPTKPTNPTPTTPATTSPRPATTPATTSPRPATTPATTSPTTPTSPTSPTNPTSPTSPATTDDTPDTTDDTPDTTDDTPDTTDDGDSSGKGKGKGGG